ncbi:hypothetical protein ACKRZS_006959 [Fusarium odoratissimum]
MSFGQICQRYTFYVCMFLARMFQFDPKTQSGFLVTLHTKDFYTPMILWLFHYGIYNGSDFNISTYLTDAGLWTACHESRLTMQKHFLQDPWLSPPWTGYYISGGAPAFITIRYNDDLVILQLDSLEFEKWDDETVGRLQNIHDIDIEYRAEWSIDFYEEDEGGDEADAF